MEIEFNGTTASEIEQIFNNQGIEVEIFPLSSRDVICPREEGRAFGNGETYYFVEESCWHGYYYCGGFNCGRTSTHRPLGRSGAHIRTKSSLRRSQKSSDCNCTGVDCSGSSDCNSSSSDSAGAILIFLAIIALLIALAFILPALAPAIVVAIEFIFASLLVLFDLITFGIFRKNFRRVLLYIPTLPPDYQVDRLLKEIAAVGGLPRRGFPGYSTNGFWIFRTGVYLFFPGLFGTLLVFWLQPDNGFIFRTPIVTFILSILLVWFGNFLIHQKRKKISQS